jgi:hypothetical protein
MIYTEEEIKKAAHWIVIRAWELDLYYNPEAHNTGDMLDFLNLSPHANEMEALKMLKKSIEFFEYLVMKNEK